MPRNGEAVGHPGDIVTDAAQARRLAVPSPPPVRERIGSLAIIFGQIADDPLRLQSDRPQLSAVVQLAIEVALEGPLLRLQRLGKADQRPPGGANLIDRL